MESTTESAEMKMPLSIPVITLAFVMPPDNVLPLLIAIPYWAAPPIEPKLVIPPPIEPALLTVIPEVIVPVLLIIPLI